jgi:HD-GYP domain-containing protein (c-di-GMP phosphodiesterase class II)
VVELHHENWDGSGYPWGLNGEKVPLGARIVHVADAYDAMTSDRPYRPGMRHEEAIRVLQKFAGTQCDPAIVEVFVGLEHTVLNRQDRMDTGQTSAVRKLAEAVGASGPLIGYAGAKPAREESHREA